GDTRPSISSIRVVQSFSWALAANLSAADLMAPLALPTAFCASPLTSCAPPLARNLSLPTALPTPCLTLPAASLAYPLILSVVLPMEMSSDEWAIRAVAELLKNNPPVTGWFHIGPIEQARAIPRV